MIPISRRSFRYFFWAVRVLALRRRHPLLPPCRELPSPAPRVLRSRLPSSTPLPSPRSSTVGRPAPPHARRYISLHSLESALTAHVRSVAQLFISDVLYLLLLTRVLIYLLRATSTVANFDRIYAFPPFLAVANRGHLSVVLAVASIDELVGSTYVFSAHGRILNLD